MHVLAKMKKALLILFIIFSCSNVCVASDFDEEVNPWTNELDYVRSESWLEAQGNAKWLRLDFENADSAPTGTGFYKVSDTETRFYVNGTHVHTWTVTVAAEYLLLDDGISKILLSDGTSFLLKTP